MLCEKCKIRKADVRYTEIGGNTIKEHHYCIPCAKDMDFVLYNILEGDFPLAKLLSGFLSDAITDQQNQSNEIVCPECGTTYEQFVADSRFGCKDCYSVFGILIEDNIKQLQGSDIHKGKKPKILPESRTIHISPTDVEQDKEEDDIITLQRLMKMAVEEEEYEKAAMYRDKIKALNKGE